MNHQDYRRISINLLPAVLTATVLATTLVVPSFAAPKFGIDNISYGGSGCPGGSVDLRFSPNGQTVNIQTNQFIADGNTSRQRRKSCNLTIPIQVPSGYQVAIRNADYRGYVSPRTEGNLRTEYFFAGERGPVFSRRLRSGNYHVRHYPTARTNLWSRCGDSVNMRVNASVTANGQGIARVEQMALNMAWRRCR